MMVAGLKRLAELGREARGELDGQDRDWPERRCCPCRSATRRQAACCSSCPCILRSRPPSPYRCRSVGPGSRPPVKITVEVPGWAVERPAAGGAGVGASTGDHHAAWQVVGKRGNVRGAAGVRVGSSVMVRVETPLALMVVGLKALPSVGGMITGATVKVALAGAALLPLSVFKASSSSVLR